MGPAPVRKAADRDEEYYATRESNVNLPSSPTKVTRDTSSLPASPRAGRSH